MEKARYRQRTVEALLQGLISQDPGGALELTEDARLGFPDEPFLHGRRAIVAGLGAMLARLKVLSVTIEQPDPDEVLLLLRTHPEQEAVERRFAIYARLRDGCISEIRWLPMRLERPDQGLRILAYHRFQRSCGDPGSHFDKQCAYLAGHWEVVSLRQASERLASGSVLPDRCIAMTVDDGYRDFLWALDSVRRHRAPITIFLVTSFVDGRDWLWVDKIRFAFRNTPLQKVALAIPRSGNIQLELSSQINRARACSTVRALAKQLQDGDRVDLIERLGTALEIDLPRNAPDEHAPMTWKELRSLPQGIECGAHTDTHPILSKVGDPADVLFEVQWPRTRIRAEIGAAAEHFAYPNGQARDFDERTVQAVAAAGYTTAVTMIPGANNALTGRLRLNRVPVQPNLPLPLFRLAVQGWTE